MAANRTRILSDLHYGDRASRITTLSMLRPLFDGVDALVLNGDTIDTRPSATPEQTRALRAETEAFFREFAPPTTFLTGNHDPDFAPRHTLDLADGRLFVTHGDIIFEDLVPWGQDAPEIRRLLDLELARLAPDERDDLDARLGVYRRVAAAIPQRHQSERHQVKYAVSFVKDTVWPPLRIVRVLRAWQRAPGLAAALTRRYRPRASFVAIGHIHRPGFWQLPNGITVLNTGAFCPPSGACLIDVLSDRLELRRIVMRGGEFAAGTLVAEFRL